MMARESWLSRAASLIRGRTRPDGDGAGHASPEAGRGGSPNDTPRPAVRLVLDTNVFVAAAYKPESSSRQLLDAVAEGRATLLVSPSVFGEYRAVLPQAVRSADAERQIRDWIARAEPVEAGRAPSTLAQ